MFTVRGGEGDGGRWTHDIVSSLEESNMLVTIMFLLRWLLTGVRDTSSQTLYYMLSNQ